MGKKNFHRRGGKGKKKPRDNRDTKDENGYSETILHSDKFNEYYKTQGIVPESEWDTMLEICKVDLPMTWRINKTTPFAKEIKSKLEEQFLKSDTAFKEVLLDGKPIPPPSPIEWYPDNYAWYFRAGKKEIRKIRQYSNLHKFLVHQNEYGNLSRQEAVSMIPAFFLQVTPDHKVLDMCAAPGSKTAQLVEFLHDGLEPGVLPKGIVIANDAELKRCHVLVHQINRLASPNVMVTCHNAELFPMLKGPIPEGEDPALFEGKTTDGRANFCFDRILCDVPCSGDGTVRKAPDVWAKWNANLGIGLHWTQTKIAWRGAKLLKVGGQMIYSTCSLNPIENEAVVASLLREANGSLVLKDCSNEMTNLIRRPGMSSWKVKSRDGTWYASHEEVPSDIPHKLPRCLFPPSPQEAQDFHLERCMRFFPHIQDTGGFFVAVLQKKSLLWDGTISAEEKPIGKRTLKKVESSRGNREDAKELAEISEKSKDEKEEKSPGNSDEIPEEAKEAVAQLSEENAPVAPKRKTIEEPFLLLSDHLKKEVERISGELGLKNFPQDLLTCRSEKSPKLYMVSPVVRDLTARNKLQIVAEGVRIFSDRTQKDESVLSWRIAQDAAQWVRPYITKRIVKISETDFQNLLKNQNPLNSTLSEPVQKQLEPLGQGPLLLEVSTSEKSMGGTVWSAWRSPTSTTMFLRKEDKEALAHFGEEFNQSAPTKEGDKEGDKEGKQEVTAMEAEAETGGDGANEANKKRKNVEQDTKDNKTPKPENTTTMA